MLLWLVADNNYLIITYHLTPLLHVVVMSPPEAGSTCSKGHVWLNLVNQSDSAIQIPVINLRVGKYLQWELIHDRYLAAGNADYNSVWCFIRWSTETIIDDSVNILMAFLKAVEFIHQAGTVRACSKAVSRLQCLITVSTGLGKPAFIYVLPLWAFLCTND